MNGHTPRDHWPTPSDLAHEPPWDGTRTLTDTDSAALMDQLAALQQRAKRGESA